MDQNTIQSEIGGCPKSDHAKMHVLSVFTVFSGGRWIMGGVCPYTYIYIYPPCIPYMSYSLNSLKGAYVRDYMGTTIGLVKGDTRTLNLENRTELA